MDIKLLLQIAGVLLGLLYLWLEYRADKIGRAHV